MTQIPIQVSRKLQSLRRAVAMWLWARGLSRVIFTAAVVVLLSMAVDGLFHMDQAQRAIFLVLMIAAVVYVAWRWLVVPLRVQLGDEQLCMQVEARHPTLGQRVISAVEFARGFDAAAMGVSPSMVDATIQQGGVAADAVPFDDVIDQSSMRRAAGIAAAAFGMLMLVLVLGTIFAPDALGLWARRAFLLSSETWPRTVNLDIQGLQDDGTVAFPRGDDWDQFVDVTKGNPTAVYIDYRPMSGGRVTTDQMTRVADDRYRFAFKSVINEFRFRVRGGDHTTAWVNVRLTERPDIESLQLTLERPGYTGVGPEQLSLGEGSYYVLAGSTIRVTGSATKPLLAADLAVGKETIGEFQINGDGRSFTGSISPEQLTSGTYAIRMTDRDELTARRPTRFTVKVVPDRAPLVRAQLRGITGMVTTNATIPMAVEVTDDFTLTGLRLTHEVTVEGQTEKASGELDLASHVESLASQPLTFDYNFELEPLQLVVGQVLSFSVQATDNDTVTGPKEAGSAPYFVRVVTSKELREELVRREQEQRLEFERLLSDQQDLLSEVQVLMNRLRQDGDLTAEDRQALSNIEKRQRQVGNRSTSIADRFEAILQEYVNNKLEEPRGNLMRRLNEGILEPLRRLPVQFTPRAADWIDTARKTATADRLNALTEAEAVQRRIVAEMRSILTYMQKLEGYQEAVRLLNEIMSDQDEVYKNTIRKLREIWGD